jgi:hypothetical protein
MPRLRWFTWVGVLGAGILGWGLLWLAVSSYVVQMFTRFGWVASGNSSSIGSQILAVLGALFFATEAADWLRRR